MRKWTVMGWTALVALCAAPAFGVTIELVAGDVADGKSAVNIVLRSEGSNVGGMQNDILFDTTKVNLPAASACKVNAAIGTAGNDGCEADPVEGPCKTLSRNLASCGATPTPPGCEGQPATVSRFRGIVAATAVPNNNSIPDGAVLYTCDFSVVNAAGLPATLTNSNVVASDPFGTRLTATGTNGTIGGGAEPTPTEVVEPTPTPTTAPVACTAPICVNVGTATATGAKVTINVVATGNNLGGAQNDILFDTTKVNLAAASACKINAAIGTAGNDGCEADPVEGPCKTLSRNLASCGASPTPPGCEGQPATVSRFRGIVAATAVPNNNPIPTGSVLYSCEFDVVNAGALPAVLTNSNIVASDPFGTRLESDGSDGAINGEGEPPTPTNTPDVVPPTNTPVPPTNTPVPPTNTPVPPTNTAVPATNTPVPATATATRTATAVPTQPAGEDDDDGCAIAADGSSNSRAWILLIPAFGLVALRRRRRA